MRRTLILTQMMTVGQKSISMTSQIPPTLTHFHKLKVHSLHGQKSIKNKKIEFQCVLFILSLMQHTKDRGMESTA